MAKYLTRRITFTKAECKVANLEQGVIEEKLVEYPGKFRSPDIFKAAVNKDNEGFQVLGVFSMYEVHKMYRMLETDFVNHAQLLDKPEYANKEDE